jgi:excinuclease ABC subunit A
MPKATAKSTGSKKETAPMVEAIRLRGARTHNLKNVDIDLPLGKLIVLTGPSGSGKSSLAIDTIHAEGQRQYIESLAASARQYFDQMERPPIESIEGLPPTICIDQRPGPRNPRSTVATITEIHDYLRLLYARLGERTCSACGAQIRPQSLEQIQSLLLSLAEGSKVVLFAPMVRGKKGEHEEVFAAIRKAGFVRARVDDELVDLDNRSPLTPAMSHTIEAVVDRLVIRAGVENRLAESLRLTAKHGEGQIAVAYSTPPANGEGNEWINELFSTRHNCPGCERVFPELEPRSFSFNSPYGACPKCDGLGWRDEFDADLVLPDKSLSLGKGAVLTWKGESAANDKKRRAELSPLLHRLNAEWDMPLEAFPDGAIEKLFRGDDVDSVSLLNMLERDFSTALEDEQLDKLSLFRGPAICSECQGARLSADSRSVRVGKLAIHEFCRFTAGEAEHFLSKVKVAKDDAPIWRPIVREIARRLQFLREVGADYISLDRPADTLSGGELQRVRLATVIGSGLVGVCYVLDEPSIGLHPRDNARLIAAIRRLQEAGNTVIVVEHDEAIMRQADWLVDVGPGAGAYGGQILSAGAPEKVANDPASVTGRFLAGEQVTAASKQRRKVAKTRAITVEGCAANNLKRVDCWFPLGVLTAITGVSGSGKSSLVVETLTPAIQRRLGFAAPRPGAHVSLRGVSQISRIVPIDQHALGRNPRGNPATYTGALDEIRRVFAATREAKQLGFSASRFSFNSKEGRCETCQGQGHKKIEMNLLPDLYVTCESCGGARYNRQTLEVRFRGKSISDVLDLSAEEAAQFFENIHSIHTLFASVTEIGLGYLRLGQPLSTLSGGEAQRLKLATELAKHDTTDALYVLDEPTTGLHFEDVRRLLGVLQRLVDRGNTVIVIEHHLDVIKSADWVIDLGPEGGAGGGLILAAGTPEEIAAIKGNETGRFLLEHLGN